MRVNFLPLLLLLLVLLLICEPSQPQPVPTRSSQEIICFKLEIDCPGTENDRTVCERAALVDERVVDGHLIYSYYNCDLNRRTPTLIEDSECKLIY